MPAVTAGTGTDKLSGRRHGRLVKRLVPLAAAVAVTFSSTVAAQAFGLDVFGALARWTNETFHLAASTNTAESKILQFAVQGAFDSCGVTIPAPAWYPEDTVLTGDIDVIEDIDCSIVTCDFMYDSYSFYIMVQQYHENTRIPSAPPTQEIEAATRGKI